MTRQELKPILIYVSGFILWQIMGIIFMISHYRNYPEDVPTWDNTNQAIQGFLKFLKEGKL